MKYNQVMGLCVFVLGLMIVMISCEYDVAQPAWNEDNSNLLVPVIDRIEPADSAVAGVNYITIYGEDFASTLENNHVYFSNVEVDVVSGNDSTLKVYRPDIVDDDITIKVNSYEADVVASYDQPYKVTSVLGRFGSFAENAQIAAMRINNDIMYVAMQTPVLIYQISAQGDKTFIDTASVKAPVDITLSPNNEMVFMSNFRRIYKTNLNETELVVDEWIDSGSGDYVVTGDYDQWGNFYFGGRKTDLRVVTSIEDSTGQHTDLYGNNEIFYMRIYGDYIYVLAENPELGIRRHQLHSDGTVDAGELLLTWADTVEFAELTPKTFTLSEDGILYVGVEGEGAGTILSYDTNTETFDVLYKNIIPSYAVHLDWGPGQYLYMLLGGDEWNILEIDMGTERAAL